MNFRAKSVTLVRGATLNATTEGGALGDERFIYDSIQNTQQESPHAYSTTYCTWCLSSLPTTVFIRTKNVRTGGS